MNRYWNILRAQKRPIRFLISRILMRLGISSWFKIRQQGFVLRFHRSSVSASLWVDPMEHQAEANFFRSYLRTGDVVVDVGSNIGLTALAASDTVGETGKVYAFEPHPTVFRYLEENVTLNKPGNVVAKNVALGKSEETVVMSDLRADDHNFIINKGDGIKIPQLQLDNFEFWKSGIALLKIDVEGYEKFVFQGAEKTLDKTGCVYFESWDQHFARFDYSTADLVDWLTERQFKVFRIGCGNVVEAVPRGYQSSKIENLIALRDLDDFIDRTRFQIVLE